MPADSERGRSAEMLTGVPDRLSAEIGAEHANAPLWPWSYRVAGARSSWPAVELYEAGMLLDVVSSTRLVAQIVRGARCVGTAGGRRVIAWGRQPLSDGVPTVEFSAGRRRVLLRQAVAPAMVTSWCWLAVASGPYDAVTVSYDGVVARQRLRMSRSRP